MENLLPDEAVQACRRIRNADIVVGIPSYNNARTIAHVVRAAQAGLAKYFPHYTAVIVNSDGGSKDGTKEAVLSAHVEQSQLLMLATPMFPLHRLSVPYHGLPGKGSAFRLIFQMAHQLGAKACTVVDSDLRSITPEWFDLLLRPIIYAGYDFVAPYYHRHKYDGTITNSIVYPLTRALYGSRVRQPIGGDFGLSSAIVAKYLESDDWETDVARYGIDIWMTTTALAEGFRVCQSFLGAKLHDAKDPGSDLSAMLEQVVGSVFLLMERYQEQWKARSGSDGVELFGFKYDVGLDPIQVDVQRMLTSFRNGCEELREIWSAALQAESLEEVQKLAASVRDGAAGFRLEDELWARLIYDFACAHKKRLLPRNHLLRSLTPLYLGRVASFVLETQTLFAGQVEERIEQLCISFEALKAYLISRWEDEVAAPVPTQKPDHDSTIEAPNSRLEVSP